MKPSRGTENASHTLPKDCQSFKLLATEIGLAHESFDTTKVDSLHQGFETLSGRILSYGSGGISALEGMLDEGEESWIRFLAAASLVGRDNPIAIGVLKALKSGTGMVAISASVTLGAYLQKR